MKEVWIKSKHRTLLIISTIGCCLNIYAQNKTITLPERGICAHRGDITTHPENTLAAFREAIRLGVHMIEFDIWLTKDNKPVVIHDALVNRTTNGTGRISDFTLKQIKKLDAGSWKSPDFKGEKVPTLAEVLQVMPRNIWLNVHIQAQEGDNPLVAKIVAETLVKENRLHQAFVACPKSFFKTVKSVDPAIMYCILGKNNHHHKSEYIEESIEMKTDFIQFHHGDINLMADYVKILMGKDDRVRINYYAKDLSDDQLRFLFECGVDFILVDDIAQSMKTALELGIRPMVPEFNDHLNK